MSQRVKKPGRPEECQAKRRRRRPTGSDVDEDGTRSGSNSGGNGSLSGVWTPKHLGDLKVASIYNRNSAEAPAELYRKDLISAMKLPDSEPLTPEEYWLITDPWKQEWERGVQVPVNPESLPESQVVVISPVAERSHDFRLPKKKYVRVSHDDFFNPDYHQLVSTAARAEKVCSYDLDDVDAGWLGCANADRVMQTLPVISEFLMEQVVEELELQCWEQVQTILKSQEGLGIEFDENVICDVCRSPESEEGNEMVFCDSCNICVHQACYGITSIPSGSFLCRTCTLGIRPTCILCPNMGGAMKATRSGHKWAHVACAIWIPEVSIGSVEKMEPITKISAIPQSRWSLICVICKEKSGACIQCSVKTCKTAYHVTCAFKNGLEMKPIIVDENAEDGIKLRSYCEKHSVNTKKEKTPHSGSEEDVEKKKSRAMTAEERNLARAEKLQQIESEFFKYVRLKDVSQNLAVDMDIVNLIYNYWKLKRKSLNNRPLVPPRPETTQLLTQQQEQDLEQMKMFVQLRQDLERVRNLCYMVSRREKLSRSYFRLREQTFQKQAALLTADKSLENISGPERAAILDANHGPSIYDQCYSQNGTRSNYKDFESLVNIIAGDDRPELVNGTVKTKAVKGKPNGANPYKKTFVNGARRRSESLSSLSETEISVKGSAASTKAVRKPLSYLFDTDSSMDAVIMSNSTKNKALPKRRVSKGQGLKQMEKTLDKSSTSDSELDIPSPAPKSRGKGFLAAPSSVRRQPIYSDTESDSAIPKKSAPPVATKGALKEFSSKKIKQKSPVMKSIIRVSPLLQKVEDVPPLKKRGRIPGRKKKVDPFEATELIVPQREAAKKASESIRSVKGLKGKEQGAGQDGGESPGPTPVKEVVVKETPKDKVKETMSFQVKAPIRRKASVTELKKKRKPKPSEEIPPPRSVERRSSDVDGDGASAVSIVPQRQAAKKAAEHIRSCQSNVVAARLIIEDEMEASRKKSKLDRTVKISKPIESPPGRVGRPISLPTRDLGSDRNLSPKSTKSNEFSSKVAETKLGKHSSPKSPQNEDGKDSVWSFLDKGSQSACRRSRERSSSSSCTSSGSSSSSDSSSYSSSSSSRPSSPGSASPVRPKPHLPQTPRICPSPISSEPGKKLKTSERLSVGDRAETSPRAKPLPKGSGPPKSGRRRGTVPSPHPASPDTPAKPRDSVSPEKSKAKLRKSGSRSPIRRPTMDFNKPKLEEKVGARDGKSPLVKEEKVITTNSEQKRTPPKTLIRDELALSSDSEDEVLLKQENTTKARVRRQSRSSATNISPELKNRPMPKTKKKELGLLSEDSGSADEKENCLSPSPADSLRKSQKSVLSTPISLLSPLSRSEENKEIPIPKASDSEPESKRPRHSPPSVVDLPSSTPSQVQSLEQSISTTSSSVAPSMPKSIFSPIPHGKESELLEFDNDLYDLARSVTVENSHETEEPSERKDCLSFSFSQGFLSREDNKEDSAMATMNLVEKLRLQHLRKSGVNHRRSADGGGEFEEANSEEGAKSPVRPGSPLKFESSIPTVRTNEEEEENSVPKSPRALSCSVLDRTKSVGGAERWAPPTSIFMPPVTASNVSIFSCNSTGEISDNVEEKPHVPQNLLQPSLLPHHQVQSPEPVSHQTLKEESISDGFESSVPQEPLVPIVSEAFERSMSDAHHSHLGLLMQNNLLSMASNVNPPLPAGISLPPGLTATYAGTSCAPLHPPPPYHSSHAPFIPYLNSTLANAVTSLASGNLPFFHTQTQIPKSSPKLSAASPLCSPPNSYPLAFAHHFGNLQPPSSLPNISGLDSAIHSTSEISRRRPSESNPLAVVTSGMLPLSKPPLTSPSRLLASNNTMTAPPPPPQSTVAQIIESVIQASNNHSVKSIPNSSVYQGKPGVGNNPVGMSFNLGLNQFQKLLDSSSSATSTSNRLNSPAHPTSNKSPLVSPPLQPSTPVQQGVSDFSAVLSNRTNENTIPQKVTPTRENGPVALTPNNTVVSPKGPSGEGRVRRPATPKVKPEKGVVEEVSPKVRGKGERKTSGASPGRGIKGSTTPRRGAGRGKYKGKHILIRKDLAGTVYDIDFDEFEENAEDKFDLRSLRDRRRSSDIHSTDYRKSESSGESPISIEKQSPRQKINLENENGSVRQRPGCGIQSSVQTPVDMRTYNARSFDSETNENLSKPEFVGAKDSSSAEFGRGSSLLMGASSVVNAKDLDDLDKTLEALSSPVKLTIITSGVSQPTIANAGINPKASQLLQNSTLGPGDSSLSSSKDSFTTTISEDNHSRHQLKFKIKGPFLDANYSSNSISHQQVTYPHQLHPHEPAGIMNTPPMINNPLNLRRMRKKELLRQYCNQDMNMDGKYTNPSMGIEYGMAGPHFHPYGRAVITIPKAVASMEIIPSGKDDYGLDPSDLCPLPTPPPAPVQEKKKRSRGVNREMAALGLLEMSKGEQWRDPSAGPVGTTPFSDTTTKKRGRAAAKSNRSTFVPPPLVESGTDSGRPPPSPTTGKSGAPSVVTAVNHPTPKLKIKFADFQSSSATCTTGITSCFSNDSNHLNHSDKETPSKKAKGRPPKKRGLAEIPTPPPPPMEELKRQSLMFREMIMKDFANADDRGQKGSGGKKKKKSKKSKRALYGDTYESNRSKSPEVKIITDSALGPKLILRFGRNRTGSSETVPNNNNNNGGVKKENGTVLSLSSEKSTVGEQDSGFTGSSEGSGGSWTPSVSTKPKFASLAGVLRTNSSSPLPNHKKSEDNLELGLKAVKQEEASVTEPVGDPAILKSRLATADSLVPSTSTSTATSPTLSKSTNDKVMPIRLKLHRCYEGYATTKEVDRENTNPKQSDSCEVR